MLWAVDDLLVEIGYSAMTMKNIAERAGVSRQTVYRWWSTKAEILHEATTVDAGKELVIEPTGDLRSDLTSYLEAVIEFLTALPAGAVYRALLGEAQHDAAVAALVAESDPLIESAKRVLASDAPAASTDADAASLVGPVAFWILGGRDAAMLSASRLANDFVASRTVQG